MHRGLPDSAGIYVNWAIKRQPCWVLMNVCTGESIQTTTKWFLLTFVLNCSLGLLWKLNYCKALSINSWLGPNVCANAGIGLWWGWLVIWWQAVRWLGPCWGAWWGNRCCKQRGSILEKSVTTAQTEPAGLMPGVSGTRLGRAYSSLAYKFFRG